MTTQKPKISFNATPPRSSVEQPFDRDAWEQQLTAPPSPQPRRVLVEAIPKAPGLKATGLMMQPEPEFVPRNTSPLFMGAVVVLTFLLGLATAMLWLDRGASTPLQTAVHEPFDQTLAEDATRMASQDLTDVSATGLPSGAVAVPVGELRHAVLAGLPATGPARVRTQEQISRNAVEVLSATRLRMLREAALAGLYGIEMYQAEGQNRIRLRFVNAALTHDAASELLFEGLAARQPELAEALLGPDGALDAGTMMFSLIRTSLMDHPGVDGPAAARDMSRRIFAASPARSETVGGLRLYTVQPGDSLAYISLQFYGMPDAYTRILEANRDTLQSPDKIQIGQRLIIPS